jgi:hypothetical protein
MRALIVSCLLLALSGYSHEVLKSLPNGSYSGQGNWSDKLGNEGSYDATIKLSENSLSLDYKWESGALSLNVSFAFDENGWFDVKLGDEKIGQGFCTENQCRYYAELQGVKFGETLVFAHDLLLKAGFKKIGDNIIRWEELLLADEN